MSAKTTSFNWSQFRQQVRESQLAMLINFVIVGILLALLINGTTTEITNTQTNQLDFSKLPQSRCFYGVLFIGTLVTLSILLFYAPPNRVQGEELDARSKAYLKVIEASAEKMAENIKSGDMKDIPDLENLMNRCNDKIDK